MDTKGHEECAIDAGRPELKKALKDGQAEFRLEALYLGNWLTDVSQLVDPVAVANARVQLEEKYQIATVVLDANEKTLAYKLFGKRVRRILADWRTRLNDALDQFAVGGQASALAQTAKRLFFFLGYKKFVRPLPDDKEKRARMHYDSYKVIAKQRYTQYYPHEHMDRYPGEPGDRGCKSAKIAAGTHTAMGHGTGNQTLSPHIYEYLVPDIRIAAGLLADVDHKWAARAFRKGPRWKSDDLLDWNEWLAKLGHALHAVEDFFVHSNFIELALVEWPEGGKYLPRRANSMVRDTSWQVVQKRLTRYQGKEAFTCPPESGIPPQPASAAGAAVPEKDVVTGYFDFTDTFFSIRHVHEEVFGDQIKPVEDHAAPWRKLLYRTVKRIKEQTDGRPQVTHEEARVLARQALEHEAAHGDPDVKVAANEVLNEVPPEVRDSFLDAVAGLSARATGTSLSLFAAWEAIHEFTSAITMPVRWLQKNYPVIAKLLEEFYEDNYEKRIQTIVDNFVGRSRVGSHSLLAKDYAWEMPDLGELDDIYKLAKNCSKAVHWYIMHVLTRSRKPAKLKICRAHSGSSGKDGQENVLDCYDMIDWVELLECFLRNPNAQVPGKRPVWWQSVVQDGWKAMPSLFGDEVLSTRQKPHDMVFIPEGTAIEQINAGSSLRSEAEVYYNTDPIVAKAEEVVKKAKAGGAAK